jgi:hypothetical protein
VQSLKHATKHGYATQSEAEPNTPNTHIGRETGLKYVSRGPGETAHRGLASGTRRDVRPRPTQGRVYMIKSTLWELSVVLWWGNASLCRSGVHA